MTDPPTSPGYEIRIRGRVSDTFQHAFEDLNVRVNPVETVVWSPELDQGALYGVLETIESLGLELVEVRRLPSAPAPNRLNPSNR
ncbi:hypothetical protein ACH35V_19900 [Actinomadura sp. 1N219]|uniref:hypothetical protein n=1 Tax=Actinomadura sp. 1N219 TaxID=3375152 RepID=UPI003795E8EE